PIAAIASSGFWSIQDCESWKTLGGSSSSGKPRSAQDLVFGMNVHRPFWWSYGPGVSGGYSVPCLAMQDGQVRGPSSACQTTAVTEELAAVCARFAARWASDKIGRAW